MSPKEVRLAFESSLSVASESGPKMVVFKPGELICRAEPFVHVLNYAEKGVRCDACFRALK